MKRNISIMKFILLTILSVSCSVGLLKAQANQPKKSTKIKEIVVDGTVKNETGNFIANASITIGEGGASYYTNNDGKFSVKVKMGSMIIVEALGYDNKYVDTKIEIPNIEIIMHKTPLYSGVKNRIELPNLIQSDMRHIVGAVSKINGADLESYPDMMLNNALQGKLLGLSSIMTSGGLANNPSDLFIRGLHRDGGNNIVVIVDGVERTIDMINAEEISSVEVLKDATAKILYGPRAANGVLLITTKRGEKYKRIIKVNVERGIQLPVAMPKYLDSYNYAKLYNEARTNDGLTPLYSPTDLTGYQNSTGPNDLRYPNVDYYNYFMKKLGEYRKANFEFSGGNDLARYAFVGGYNGNAGLQSVGETPQRDRFFARGNLDMKVTENISAYVGISGIFDITKRSSFDHAATFAALSSYRPNENALIVDETIIKPDSAGFPPLAVGIAGKENLLNQLQYGGNRTDENINGQLNFGLNFDLKQIAKGLSAKAQVSFDNYFKGSAELDTRAATYLPRWIMNAAGNQDSLLMILQSKTNISDKYTLPTTFTYNTKSIIGSINYKNVFNNVNALNIDLVTNYMKTEVAGDAQDLVFVNNALRVNYVRNDKYIVELDGAYMGSNKFIGSNQHTPSFSAGLGWIASEEDFIKNIASVNYLKIKASAGMLAYDGQTGYNNYRDRWSDNGSSLRLNNTLAPAVTNFNQLGNPNLKWEKSSEFNVGLEALLFDRKLWAEVNYFNETRSDMIQSLTAIYSGVYGGLFSNSNWGKVANSGIEAELKYSDKIGDLQFQVGGNVIVSKNELLAGNETAYPGDASRIGKSTDAMLGYVAEGLFGKDVPLAGHAVQTFGGYQDGDIAYQDLNSDGVIDELDRKQLGNSFPTAQLGIDFNLNYKGFGLYVLGTSQLGVSSWKNNNYYWVNGEDKYSVATLDRYHAIENPTGSFPRLTTTSGSNNNVNSSYWIQSADFFRLKNVELNYTFNDIAQIGLKQLKLYVRGTNLFQLSQVKDFDPEVPNAGISNYPILKTYTVGCSINF